MIFTNLIILSRILNNGFRKTITHSIKKKYWFNSFLHSIPIKDTYFYRILILSILISINYLISILFLTFEKQILINSLYLFFLIIDSILILSLPKLKISYGAFTEQIFINNLPRFFVTFITSILFINFNEKISLITFIFLQTFGSIVYIYGMIFEVRKVKITKLSSGTKKIQSEISFVHLTDIHIENITIREIQVSQIINEIVPEFIFLTGDYLNLSNINDLDSHEQLKLFISGLKSKYGIFASMGSPPVDNREVIQFILESVGVTVLRDEALQVQLQNGDKLNILGIDCDHRQKIDFEVTRNLIKQLDTSVFTILLFHSPEVMPFVKNLEVDLYLCGHTHGGQVRLPFYGAILTSSVTGKKYEKGLYIENETQLYVNSGLGLEGKIAPRIRLLCPPELLSWKIKPY